MTLAILMLPGMQLEHGMRALLGWFLICLLFVLAAWLVITDRATGSQTWSDTGAAPDTSSALDRAEHEMSPEFQAALRRHTDEMARVAGR